MHILEHYMAPRKYVCFCFCISLKFNCENEESSNTVIDYSNIMKGP